MDRKFHFLIILFLVLSFNLQSKVLMRLGAAPDNSYKFLEEEFLKAQESIDINIYEFYSPELIKTLLTRLQDNIRIRILMEGQPTEGFQPKARDATNSFVKAFNKYKSTGSEIRFMWAENRKERRYVFNHAKYVIIDGKEIFVGSENFNVSGYPLPEYKGNRGWMIAIYDQSVANTFKAKFENDFSTQFKDVIGIKDKNFKEHFLPNSEQNDISHDTNTYKNPVPTMDIIDSTCTAEPIFAPDNALNDILSLINNANSSIDLELMTFQPYFKSDDLTEVSENPILTALKKALNRGVKVRALLNDPSSFGGGPPPGVEKDEERGTKNTKTVDNSNYELEKLLKQFKKSGLPVQVYISKNSVLGINYIHNKGMIIDGNKVLISSVNWGKNSATRNREAGVAISCSSVAGYYLNLFNKDWDLTMLGLH